MKILKNYTLIYDNQCPLCQTYTKVFVATGILDKTGRQAFQEISNETCILIDKKRACNEIALINNDTGEVIYGIDSILKILTAMFPYLKNVFFSRPVYWFLKKLYSFISFNRKVIMPSKKVIDTCTPDFNYKYRIVYLFFTWVISAFILTNYIKTLQPLNQNTSFEKELILIGGQMLFQSIVLHKLTKEKIVQYLGNMMTISFAGAIILSIISKLGVLFIIKDLNFYLIVYITIVFLMFYEHIRRVKILEISTLSNYSWLTYQAIHLLIIVII